MATHSMRSVMFASGLRKTGGSGGVLASSAIFVPNSTAAAKRHQRSIATKANREYVDKPKPYPYETKAFGYWALFTDPTTWRFDENTKVIVVDGADGVGKTEFAKTIADEFEMKYFPDVSVADFFRNQHGEDLADFAEFLMPRVKPYTEKDFFRNPTPDVPGCADRFVYVLFKMRMQQYWHALRHLFNTGQGVVLERGIHSHYVLMDAMYNAGYIDKWTVKHFEGVCLRSMHHFPRPNVIINLEAPIDVVQRKIKALGNEWDQDSPLWKNAAFLQDLYEGKRDYLEEAKVHSQVLTYDWSEPGEMETVIDDLEGLNLDEYGVYELQQKDWRFADEELVAQARFQFSSEKWWSIFMNAFLHEACPWAEHLFFTGNENCSLGQVAGRFPGQQYAYGYNPLMGDKNLWMKFDGYESALKTRTGWNKMQFLPWDHRVPENMITKEKLDASYAAEKQEQKN